LPGYEGRPLGIFSSGGLYSLNDRVAQKLRVPKEEVETLAAGAQQEMERRELYYRSGRAAPDFRDRMQLRRRNSRPGAI
jgi:predicted phosphoribosyltransferase